TDNAGYTTTKVISVTVSSVNDEPNITIDSSLNTDEDNNQTLSFTYTDVDGDTVSASVTTPASNGAVGVTGTTVSYAPNANFNGTDSFTLTLTDNAGYTTTQVINVNVNSVNDEAEAVKDTFEFDFDDSNIYILDVLSNDSDIDGDEFYITGANTSIGSVITDGAILTLTMPAGFFGEIELTYTIRDGNASFAGAKAEVLIKGELSGNAPVITVPSTVEVNAKGLYTRVDLGMATALNSQGKPLPVSIVGQSVFRAGNHTVHWLATDAEGLTTVASQQVIVHPLISLGKNQFAVEGKKTIVDVMLNGEAPSYPFIVTLGVSGTASESDYDIDDLQVTFMSGTQASLIIDIVQDNMIEGDETLIINIEEGNIGHNPKHVINIVETNVAPDISLSSSQNTEARDLVTPEGGLVTIQASVFDINDDNVNTQWLYDGVLNINDINKHTILLDPSELNPGVYPISLMATDNADQPLSTTQTLYLKVLDNLAMLTDADSDGDMIPDNVEGHKDSDQDGIPDFLDAISECNVMPEQVSTQNGFLMEGELGGCLRKGISLARGETGGVQLTVNDLESSIGMDDQFVSVGGVFDFIVSGLPQAGQNYRIVLPQNQPIPLGAVYRKYSEIFGWGNFVEDVNNQLHSAPGEAGYCPAPVDVSWSMGLTEGYWCVQLTIEDGGPNDNDGIANGTIVDPGGVAVALTDNTMPVAKADVVRVKRNESLVIDVLANDIDVDDDILSIGVATATFGDVNLTADNKINYKSKADFIGLDTIVYTLSDGNGGSDSGSVSVTVYANEAPVALSDSANTNDRTPITINVLSNDSDADEDSLIIVSATVDEGIVRINQGTTLTYTPDSNFSGIATISYTIDDGQGEQSTAQVTVDVEAYQQVTVNNKAKGGSMGLMIILLTGALLFRLGCRSLSKKRLIQIAVSFTAATSMSLAAAQPEWFIMGSIGQSQVKGKFSTPVGSEVTSQIWDDRDTSYSVGGGLRFVDISIMLSYEKLGEVTASYTGGVLEAESFHQELADAGPKLAEGISLQGQYRVWQGETLSASLGFGVLAWDMAQTSKINDSVISNDESDMNLFYTAALAYPLKDNMQISVKVTRYNLSINNINNIALALSYHF
ncbi:tandem-95 repeat protein, partial [Paraglaciecola sp.]|nr:tandem-95 repeat protein [Paraglaciecola sp.]